MLEAALGMGIDNYRGIFSHMINLMWWGIPVGMAAVGHKAAVRRNDLSVRTSSARRFTDPCQQGLVRPLLA